MYVSHTTIFTALLSETVKCSFQPEQSPGVRGGEKKKKCLAPACLPPMSEVSEVERRSKGEDIKSCVPVDQ